jgi:release factor glutamine methyltransferase
MRAEIGRSRRALLAEAAASLGTAGIPAPRHEARRLWTELLDEPAETTVLQPDEIPPLERAERFRQAVARRAAGEPLAYVSGWTGFRYLTLRCDARALIPRPETEGLVELVLARVPAGRVADVGTGTGCIALSLAAEGRYDQVVATDRSSSAVALAAENAGRVAARVSLVRGALCTPLRQGSFDALVANPPYLTEREYAALAPSVRSWEPAAALVSGPDGLHATARLLDEGRAVLRPGGWLALEVDCSRAGDVARRARALGWSDVAVHADLFGRERYLLARRSNGS